MFFSRWLRGRHGATTQGHYRRTQLFRPTVQVLEDRTVPSGLSLAIPGSALLTANGAPGSATHLRVVVPESVHPGNSFRVLVEAEDASNHDATGYTGAVTLSLGTADSNAKLPAAYTFTANDHGEHWFHVTLAATGAQTINASGTLTTGTTSGTITSAITGTITGAATTTVRTSTTPKPTPVATSLLVITPEEAAVGVPAHVTVEVLDAAGHVLPNYTGTITLSSDMTATGAPSRHTAAAPLPIMYTFTRRDHGVHTFQVSFANAVAAGTTTMVMATGTTTNPNTTLSGQASLTVFPATTVTHFAIVRGAVATASSDDFDDRHNHARARVGTAVPFTVEALNAANQVVTGYTGTVSFTSTDSAALVSATANGTGTALSTFTYPFTTADNGSHTFYLTFKTSGRQTLTVTDTMANAILGSIRVRVRP